VVYKFLDDQGTYLAALITYYGFASLFPLLLLLLLLMTILGSLLRGDPGLQQQILHSALWDFPIIGDQIGQNIHSSTAASPRSSSVSSEVSTAAWA
jgi:membrane protein